MIKTEQIREIIIGELEKYCGCPFVPSNTKKEMPPYPYVSFSLIHAMTLKGTYCEGEKLYKPANLTYSFTAPVSYTHLDVYKRQDVYYLVKNINDAFNSNHLKRTEDNIYRFSKTPNLNDDAFGTVSYTHLDVYKRQL